MLQIFFIAAMIVVIIAGHVALWRRESAWKATARKTVHFADLEEEECNLLGCPADQFWLTEWDLRPGDRWDISLD